MLRLSATVLTAASLLLLTACGNATSSTATTTAGGAVGSGAGSTVLSTPASAPASKTGCAPSTAPAPAGVPVLSGTPTDTAVQAVIPAGTGTPPTSLVTQDIVTCTGATATAQATVEVRYTGALYANGTVFDASWKNGSAPAKFPLSGVVKGFAQGIVGMHVGDRRTIVIPPALGYGAQASGPVPGGSTMVFVVDLVTIS